MIIITTIILMIMMMMLMMMMLLMGSMMMMMMMVSLFSASSAKVDHCLPQLLLAYAPVVVVVKHPDNKILINQSTNQPH